MRRSARARGGSAATASAALFVLAACIAPPPEEGPSAVASQALLAADLYGTTLPAKTLALTFDDGPGDRTAAMSTYLHSRGIRATFFFNGGHIAATTLPHGDPFPIVPNASALLAKLVADGHLVANHTTTHRNLVSEVLPTGSAKVIQELAETDADIAASVPSAHFLFRAPYGVFDQSVASVLDGSAMSKYVGPIRWDIGGTTMNYPAQAADWACFESALQSAGGGPTFGVTSEQCGDAYLAEIAAVGRGIVLMHDLAISAQGSTLAMVQYVVPILQARGYSFVRTDEVPAIAAQLPPIVCDASCAACNDPGPTHCTTCGAGAWLSGGTCNVCSVCAPGSHEAAACTAAADTTCSACAPGTFAATAGAPSCATCTPGSYAGAGAVSCTPCPPGTFSASGAGSCAACGGCDDGDPCTTDACSAATGCTHTRVDDCSVGDGGAEDGGAEDGGAGDRGAGDRGAGDRGAGDRGAGDRGAGDGGVEDGGVEDGGAWGSSSPEPEHPSEDGGCSIARSPASGRFGALAMGLLAAALLRLRRARRP
jgi:peptidoglycan-N-acetylglucosamine deacetylase